MAGRIVVAYAGVHQAFEIALAAQEIEELRAFYCSLYDAPTKWGNFLAKAIGHDALSSRHIDGLDATKVVEFPWPLVWKLVRDKLSPLGRDDWLATYDAFDRSVAQRLELCPPHIFVGTAGSDLRSLEVARRGGTTLVHDCPGLHPLFLRELLREAADRAGLKKESVAVTLTKWDSRKLIEYSLANVLLVYSDLHRKSFEASGYTSERLFMSPLWVDTKRWHRGSISPSKKTGPAQPLKLLFVGSFGLLKGIPFLVEAVAECGASVQLTAVGRRGPETEVLFGAEESNVRFLPLQRKSKLREIYISHDVLVLPSVADSFGFVALEAMACGLPVIVTQNTGVPVPDCSWRVPAMDSRALAQRIMEYAEDRTLVAQHGNVAIAFASNFGPEKYRHNIRELFKSLLNSRRAS